MNESILWARLRRVAGIAGAVFAAATVSSRLGAQAAASAPAQAADSVATEYVVYLISSSFCIANRQPGFLDAVAKLGPSLRRQADASSRRIYLAGVSIDVRADTGVAYLQRIGAWDEIVAGRNWMNLVVARYIWQNAYAPPVIPQVLVVRHPVSRAARSITVGDDEKVLALTGHEAIEEWVARGTPIP